MSLDTKQNKRSEADNSQLDSYGVRVKNPPTGAKVQVPQNSGVEYNVYGVKIKVPGEKPKSSHKEDSSEIAQDVFLDDVSSDFSFEDVFESIESETTGVPSLSENAEGPGQDENLPEEFLNTESYDNAKFTVSDSEFEIIAKEVPSPAQQEEDFEPAFDAPADVLDKSEKTAREGGGFDSAAKDILKQIANELAALKNEISLLKADFDELKNQEIIRPAQSVDFNGTIDSPARQEDFSSGGETIDIADDLAAGTENQSDAEESRDGFFSGGEDDETIALSGDELQNILSNSEFSVGEENGGIAEGISGVLDNSDGELPEISEETDDNIFIEEDAVQTDGETENFDVENTIEGIDVESEYGNLDIESEIESIVAEIEDENLDFENTIEIIDAESEDENLDFENVIENIHLDSEDENLDVENGIESIDFEREIEDAVNEIQEAYGTETGSIGIESEYLHETEFADIEFDDLEELEETALPEEIDILMAGKDDILVDEDFEIKNIAEAPDIFEAPFDDDLVAGEEIELAKESAETDEIETEIEPAEHKPPEKSCCTAESTEEELDDTPTDRVFGKQWGGAAAPEADKAEAPAAFTAPQKSAASATAQAPKAESFGGGLKEQVKTVLTYMDKLLENLPEEKIKEFAHSEYFDTYKKLFEELGIA